MVIEMAARRKSLKPTNKIHLQLQLDDEVYDDIDEPTVTTDSNLRLTGKETNKMKLSLPTKECQGTTNSRQPVFDLASLPGQLFSLPKTSEPHIALPSDIYQDFEALKSATNMDTTELMRKLLTDFYKITGQLPSDRKFDDVNNELSTSHSTNVLDLSKRKSSEPVPSGYKGTNSPSTALHRVYTDDQLAMGMLDSDDEVDENNDVKPLDLTLQKSHTDSPLGMACFGKYQQTNPSLLKLSSSFNEEPHCSQTFKHAGSYVINLESGNDSPQFVNSSLAQVLRMDIPLNSFNTANKATVNKDSILLTKKDITSQNCRNLNSRSSFPFSQNNFQSKLFQNDAEASTLFVKEITEKSSSSLSSLPTYAEAITSVLNAQQTKRGSLQELSAQEVVKTKQEDLSSEISFVQISADDSDVKMFPLNFTPQMLTTSGSSNSSPKQQRNLLHHLLQHQLKPEGRAQQQLQNATSQASTIAAFCGGSVSNVQMMQVPTIKSAIENTQCVTETIKNNDISIPNFLLDSSSLGLSSIQSALSNVTLGPSTLSNTSMPMSTLFMTTSANGGVGHMVAIPVIHAVSDGIAGFQPFAFAPHPVPLSNATPSTSAEFSDAATTSPPSSDTPSTANLSEQYPNRDFPCSVSYSTEAKALPSLGIVKSKPGRPRGRGGRGQSQKNQNKDMKLLTENTLFPGVYTSILKLPWSRRSRNKTKTKTIYELKKQTQDNAHSRLTKSDSSCHNDEEHKEDYAEQNNNNSNNREQTHSPTHLETLQEDLQQQQNILEQSSVNQIQHQKLKDLEQQKRLHIQYHLRLQEEQQKLTKQIEQSYLNASSDTPMQISFSTSNANIITEKQEIERIEQSQSEGSNLTNPVSAIMTSDSSTFISSMLSQDPLMIVYTNTESSTSKKVPRKRGRPPKIPNLHSKQLDNQLTFNAMSMTNTLVKSEPDNFLHTSSLLSDCMTDTNDTKPVHHNISIFPQHLLASDTDTFLPIATADFSGNRENTLENKINFLTNKIELELSQNMITQPPGTPVLNLGHVVKCENESVEYDNKMFQEMKMARNKSLVDVKPRRKKVSRLLKSDENFMYATFKIKPKGLTPRKSRKRRKDVQTNATVVTGTIANLRQKIGGDSVTSRSDRDVVRPTSMVAWKFHEQYPCSNEDSDKERRVIVCSKCGIYLTNDCDEEVVSVQCDNCAAHSADFNTGINNNDNINSNNSESSHSKISKIASNDADLKTECCLTCGDLFQKHFSDPSARCDVCQNTASRVIQSSKLFSFHDTLKVSSPLMSKSSSITSYLQPDSDMSFNERKCSEKEYTPINNNHLFCSLCRMEFTKICDYLAHIRDTHETKIEDTSQVVCSSADLSRKNRISKTKKSLAHKTLTCPVEECPHFFREQKDRDLHFLKKHANLNFSFHGNSYTASDVQTMTLQLDPSTLANQTTLEQTHETTNTGMEASGQDKGVSVVKTCEKPLQCEFCSYRCRQKNALTWHMRKHPEAASQYRKYSNLNAD